MIFSGKISVLMQVISAYVFMLNILALINKVNRVTKKSFSANDHILANFFVN